MVRRLSLVRKTWLVVALFLAATSWAVRAQTSKTAFLGEMNSHFRLSSDGMYGLRCQWLHGIRRPESRADLDQAFSSPSGLSGSKWLQRGFRAQFAHPKTLHLPSEMLPVILKKIQTRIQALVGYGCDLFIAHNTSSIPLWRKGSALDADGLEFLMSRGNEWYARRTHERTVKPGDRIAVLGRAIALVEQVSAGHVRAKLWNKTVLMIGRKCIRWDEQRDRRISVGHASVNQLSGAIMSQDGGGSEERIAALLTRMSMPPRCASSG